MGWYEKEVYRTLKFSSVYCLVPGTDCGFKILNLFFFLQSYIATFHDDLESTFREINFLSLHSHSNKRY